MQMFLIERSVFMNGVVFGLMCSFVTIKNNIVPHCRPLVALRQANEGSILVIPG